MGYADSPTDSADGFVLMKEYLRHIAANDSSSSRWTRMRSEGPGPYRYWYRQSPRYFQTSDQITVSNPAMDVSGMTTLYLDTEGRLHWFAGVPPQREPGGEAQPIDWSIPFHEAGLDLANFQSAPSRFVPLHAFDTRAAWDGTDPNRPELKMHVEAAAFHGKLVYFETIYPWDQPMRQEETPQSGSRRAFVSTVITVFLTVLIGSLLIARRNLRQGRGDLRAASRVAIFYFVVRMSVWLFDMHHNGILEYEFDMFLDSLAQALFTAAFLGVLYLALEPFIRKHWPHQIISWSRLLVGNLRDPMIGRDLLIGGVFGALCILKIILSFVSLPWIGAPPELPSNPASEQIGVNLFFGKFAAEVTAGLFIAFFAFFMLLLFVIVLRRKLLALLPLWLLLTLLAVLITGANPIMIPLTAAYSLLFVLVLYRFGLLALAFGMFVLHLWVFFPVTSELTAWYARDFTIALGICAALVIYGFYTSLGGQSLFGGKLLED
jgi:serine/threonine-protein kinase